MTGLLGLMLLIAIAWAMSSDRQRFPWRIVLTGIALQFGLALLMLHVPLATRLFDAVASGITRVLSFADAGAAFIFGEQLYTQRALGFVFAFHVLPTIIFFASLMAVLYHVGVMQLLVRAMAYVMKRALGVSGLESLAMAANVFVGQTEAPLVIRPYVNRMTISELMTLMTGGFATIAGAVFAAYVAMLGGDDPAERASFAKHLLTASLMSAPAAFVMAKIIVPEAPGAKRAESVRLAYTRRHINLLDAATGGAAEGLRLAANIGAMLLAIIALLAGLDAVLIFVGELPGIASLVRAAGMDALSLKNLLGLLFSPLAWTMGVAADDIRVFGSLLGEKLVLTEFIAYDSLRKVTQGDTPMQPRSTIIATYALCGFANLGSIAIQLGGIGGIAPERRHDLARLGLRAMIGGAMASFMTATVVGLLLSDVGT